MKPIKNQYIDLKEGRMTEAQFMRNVRMSLPQYISNITLFKQAERILINKGIISEIKAPIVEALNPADEVELENIVSKYVKDADDISKEMDAYFEKGFRGFSDVVQANLNRDEDFQSWVQRTSDEEQFRKETGDMPGFEGTLDALDKISIKEADEDNFMDSVLDILVKSNTLTQDDINKLNNGNYSELINALYAEFDKYKDYEEAGQAISTSDLNNSAKNIAKKLGKLNESLEGYYNQDGKEQYAQFDELDNMNAQEIMAGYVMEKIDNPNIGIEEATKVIVKNLKKDPYYYTNYKLTGIRGGKPEEFTSTKRKPGFDKEEEVSKKADNVVDTKNATKVIKEGLDNRDIASQIWDELQNMGSYSDADIDLKIKKRGLTGPDAEAVRVIIFDKDREDMNEEYKLLPDPSKTKLKELVRKMMKEMFDGRDNVTDVTGENN
jgi:hypothetical protein